MTDRSTTVPQETPQPPDWHTLSQERIRQMLQTGTGGLPEAEARRRRNGAGR